MQDKIWYIKNAGGVFANLSDEDKSYLAGISKMEECLRGQPFYLSRDVSDKIYLVKKGRVRLGMVNAEGNEITLDVLGPGEIFGELAVTDEKRRSHFAEATEDSLVCIFSRTHFNKFLTEHPELTFNIMKLIGFRLRELETRLQDLTFKSVSERLKTTLLRLTERHGIKEANGIRLTITQKDIAYLVGATREAVAEEIARLKRAGLLQTAYRSLLIPDLEALKKQER
ncbi:MAG: Crp/Fnr family transcriptional regulator [Desulfuromonadales bacterium]|nr:Crp/Fnr family transcriptional regulator [Desulfuromonadales bacterium]